MNERSDRRAQKVQYKPYDRAEELLLVLGLTAWIRCKDNASISSQTVCVGVESLLAGVL